MSGCPGRNEKRGKSWDTVWKLWVTVQMWLTTCLFVFREWGHTFIIHCCLKQILDRRCLQPGFQVFHKSDGWSTLGLMEAQSRCHLSATVFAYMSPMIIIAYCRGHHQMLLSDPEVNITACLLIILTHIIWPDKGYGPKHTLGVNTTAPLWLYGHVTVPCKLSYYYYYYY